MKTETFCAQIGRFFIRIEKLRFCQAVFRFFGLSDNRVPLAQGAGIVAETDKFRKGFERAVQKVDVGNVVEVDDCALFLRICVFRGGRLVACKHNALA